MSKRVPASRKPDFVGPNGRDSRRLLMRISVLLRLVWCYFLISLQRVFQDRYAGVNVGVRVEIVLIAKGIMPSVLDVVGVLCSVPRPHSLKGLLGVSRCSFNRASVLHYAIRGYDLQQVTYMHGERTS